MSVEGNSGLQPQTEIKIKTSKDEKIKAKEACDTSGSGIW